jgi:hypothetical protein
MFICGIRGGKMIFSIKQDKEKYIVDFVQTRRVIGLTHIFVYE